MHNKTIKRGQTFTILDMRRESYLQLRQNFEEFIFNFDSNSLGQLQITKDLFHEFDQQLNLEGKT